MSLCPSYPGHNNSPPSYRKSTISEMVPSRFHRPFKRSPSSQGQGIPSTSLSIFITLKSKIENDKVTTNCYLISTDFISLPNIFQDSNGFIQIRFQIMIAMTLYSVTVAFQLGCIWKNVEKNDKIGRIELRMQKISIQKGLY